MPYNWFHIGVIGGKLSLKTSGKSKKFSPSEDFSTGSTLGTEAHFRTFWYSATAKFHIPGLAELCAWLPPLLTTRSATAHSDVTRPGGWPIFEKWYISEHQFQLFIRF